jgi:hypothetical protein
LRQVAARPLEPDAGNAAEGSEGPMPDWHFSHAIFQAWLFCCEENNQEKRNAGKEFLFYSDSAFPAFLIQLFYERA